MWHMILKENRTMTKNWLSYFLSLFVPVLSVFINLIFSSTAVIQMNVLIVEKSDILFNALSSEMIAQEGIDIELERAESLEQAVEKVRNKKASVVLDMDADNEISIYYDENRTDSLGAVQYVSAFIQKINTDEISEKILENYRAELLLRVESAENVGTDTRKAVLHNVMLSMGVLWIFILTPLYSGMNGIQQERGSGTYYYLLKIPKSKPMILLSKLTAIIVQCFMSFTIFIVLFRLLGNHNNNLMRPGNIPIAILIIFSISSLGFFLGFLLKDSASSAILTTLLTIPIMLITSINMRSALDPIMKLLPTYNASVLIRDIIYGEGINTINILIVAGIAALFFSISVLLFNKKEPI